MPSEYWSSILVNPAGTFWQASGLNSGLRVVFENGYHLPFKAMEKVAATVVPDGMAKLKVGVYAPKQHLPGTRCCGGLIQPGSHGRNVGTLGFLWLRSRPHQ